MEHDLRALAVGGVKQLVGQLEQPTRGDRLDRQRGIDQRMIELDGTPNKGKLGATSAIDSQSDRNA